MNMRLTPTEIAQVAHEVNQAYYRTFDPKDTASTWENLDDHTRGSLIDGVKNILYNPDLTPEQSHKNWMVFKHQAGWKHGPVKNPDKREHPCLVPYKNLAPIDRFKDELFGTVVRSLIAIKGACAIDTSEEAEDKIECSRWKALYPFAFCTNCGHDMALTVRKFYKQIEPDKAPDSQGTVFELVQFSQDGRTQEIHRVREEEAPPEVRENFAEFWELHELHFRPTPSGSKSKRIWRRTLHPRDPEKNGRRESDGTPA